MAKILFSIYNFTTGGVEASLVQIANGLAARFDYEVTILFLGKTDKNFIFNQLSPQIKTIIQGDIFPLTIKPKPKKYLIRKIWKFRRFLFNHVTLKKIFHSGKYDILVDFRNGTSLFCLKFKEPHQQSITWMHGSFPVIHPTIETLSILSYDHIIALSDSFINDFSAAYPQHTHKLAKIYNIVNIAMIEQNTQDSSGLTAAEQELLSHPYFVHLARIDEDKDITTMIKAYELFYHQTHSHTKLYLIGSGSQMEHYQNLIKESNLSDYILMLGEQKNPFIWLQNSCAQVLSSNNEGLPCSLIEGLACNTLVVASDCPGGSAEVLGFGRYGITFKPRDIEELANILCQIDSGKISKSDFAALHEEAISRFSAPTVVDSLHNILQNN